MVKEGRPFKGCLYFGLMITKDGPKVIEYNCRFGDPETQVVLPLLDGDLFEIMQAVRYGRLADTPVKFKDSAACCLILASGGYPGKYKSGCEISVGALPSDTDVIFAGAKAEDGRLLTAGGRVLGIVSTAPDLSDAVKTAYKGAESVTFENAFYRKDIGARALAAKRNGD